MPKSGTLRQPVDGVFRLSAFFTIPAPLPFLRTLAEGLLREDNGDPLALARKVILLPSRRACRMMRQAFLQAAPDQILLLPKMRPLDGTEDSVLDLRIDGHSAVDIPPAVSGMERRLLLLPIILKFMDIPLEQAIRLADSLLELLDSLHIEQRSADSLKGLVSGNRELAAHWQRITQFLDILITLWPGILAEQQRLDPQERINRLIAAQAALWRAAPPPEEIIAAGVMWVRPATVELLRVIAALPRGRIILAGLDQAMDEDSWQALDANHPQYALRTLLERLEVPRESVQPFLPDEPDSPRLHLLREAMRPAATCDRWRALPSFAPDSLKGVIRLDAPTPHDEAQAIALIMRHTLDTPRRTAALVTPDRGLARRVMAALHRWGIDVNDSAGQPLSLTPVGGFLRLLAEMVAADFAPYPTLACLKHPLAAAGQEMSAFRAAVRRLETEALRGPRPAPGLAGLKAAVADHADLQAMLARLEDSLAPFLSPMAQPSVPLPDLLEGHLRAAEALATTADRNGALRLWQGEAGEAMAQTLRELQAALPLSAPYLPAVTPAHYPAVFTSLLLGTVVRPVWGKHPRLFLWGPLESRLVQADVMILGGLNEGTWPAAPAADPWMSRPMRKDIGLPAPEEALGRAAHDFTQAFAAPTVVLTRSERVDGTPTVPSRWLARLDAVMKAAGLSFDPDGPPWLHWQAMLDQVPPHPAATAPQGTPPLSLRPQRLSVTDVELLKRDPYALYAKKVLKLHCLDDLDAVPSAADYGTLVHAVMREFIGTPGPRTQERLEQIVQTHLNQSILNPTQRMLWAAQIRAALPAILACETDHSAVESWCEVKGETTIGPLTLTAWADRIDRTEDNTLTVIDYKTGSVPPVRDVQAGMAPQLPLEGLIAEQGGFADIPAATVSSLQYWSLKRDGKPRPAGGKDSKAPSTPNLIAAAQTDLEALIEDYLKHQKPYTAVPNPRFAPRYNDYAHLERQDEWLSPSDDGDNDTAEEAGA